MEAKEQWRKIADTLYKYCIKSKLNAVIDPSLYKELTTAIELYENYNNE